MNPHNRYDSLFQYYASVHSIDWCLLKAQVQVESDFNPDALSKVGARGLAQFMDRTWDEWRDGIVGIRDTPPGSLVLTNPQDPEDCIRAQAAYMKWLLKYWEGNVEYALASYNWGVGNVKKVLSRHTATWLTQLPDETQHYIHDVLNEYSILNAGG